MVRDGGSGAPYRHLIKICKARAGNIREDDGPVRRDVGALLPGTVEHAREVLGPKAGDVTVSTHADAVARHAEAEDGVAPKRRTMSAPESCGASSIASRKLGAVGTGGALSPTVPEKVRRAEREQLLPMPAEWARQTTERNQRASGITKDSLSRIGSQERVRRSSGAPVGAGSHSASRCQSQPRKEKCGVDADMAPGEEGGTRKSTPWMQDGIASTTEERVTGVGGIGTDKCSADGLWRERKCPVPVPLAKLRR